MKKYFIISTITLYFGCSSNIQIGKYSSPESPYTLILKKDSTYTYRFHQYFIDNGSSGYWRIIGKNKFVLKSNITEKKLLLTCVESTPDQGNRIDFENLLTIETNIPKKDKNCYECLIYIDDSLYSKRNCDSIHSMEINKKIGKIFLQVHSYSIMPGRFFDTLFTSPCYTKLQNHNSLKINMIFKDSLFNYKVFDNTIFDYKNGKVNFYDSTSESQVSLPFAPHHP